MKDSRIAKVVFKSLFKKPATIPYMGGKLKLDELVSATYQPEQVHEALEAMHGGALNRAVLTWT